ncbi:tyrosine-type recombinase/integrase [Limnobacter sp.]|uniref:tyrosine-type recombinase/integrase n=1 Tax=Limnobacter sp. TaxID=2003368 RepID=UPI0027332280|nr:tyrosine-type recombinase/integrase [Limnobacter sp.]MDP3272102.1 tyrosine-type recombinase/integrase [Limnobacter sp.]
MAGKIRHLLLRDGRYYARRIVPHELRDFIQKNELRIPLGSDRRAAIEQLPFALVKINSLIDHARDALQARDTNAAASVRALSEPMSDTALAKDHYQRLLARDIALRNAGPSWASIGIDDRYVADLRAVLAGKLTGDQIEGVLGDTLERYRAGGSIVAPPGSIEHRQTARALAGAELEALERIVERDDGADPASQHHPTQFVMPPVEAYEPPEEPLSLRELLETHLRAYEAQGRGRAMRKAWPRVFEDLLEFLCGQRRLTGKARRQADDARRLTPEELIAWRDEKLKTLAAKTVKDVWLASVKAVLQRAVDDRKLGINPATAVKLRAELPPLVRPKGYMDSEALVILKACRDYLPIHRANPRTMESAHITAAKRWGQWLCAFTGARVSEMMQLRKCDVRKEGDIHYVRITPDAGTVKARAFRDVPLHSQLIELGFLEFVARAQHDALFISPTADPEKRPAEVSSGRLSTWLRETGLAPAGVAPNHGWRHRFKTQSIDLDFNPRVVDAIQGHTGRTASDGYGEVSLKAKKAAIDRLPHYILAAS